MHFEKLVSYFLFDVLLYKLELSVVLQHFSGNIKRQVSAVYNTLDKAEIIRKQICALVHNQHAVGIKSKSFFVFSGIVVKRCFLRNIQKRVIGNLSLCLCVNYCGRVIEIKKSLFVIVVVFLRCYLTLVLTPDRYHTVECSCLCYGLIFRLYLIAVFVLNTCTGFHSGCFKVHLDRI